MNGRKCEMDKLLADCLEDVEKMKGFGENHNLPNILQFIQRFIELNRLNLRQELNNMFSKKNINLKIVFFLLQIHSSSARYSKRDVYGDI